MLLSIIQEFILTIMLIDLGLQDWKTHTVGNTKFAWFRIALYFASLIVLLIVSRFTNPSFAIIGIVFGILSYGFTYILNLKPVDIAVLMAVAASSPFVALIADMLVFGYMAWDARKNQGKQIPFIAWYCVGFVISAIAFFLLGIQ